MKVPMKNNMISNFFIFFNFKKILSIFMYQIIIKKSMCKIKYMKQIINASF